MTDVLVASTSWEIVEVEVPPGPLGILLDGTSTRAAVLEGFAPVSADRSVQGAVEASGHVPPGSVLVRVNEYDLVQDCSTFQEIGEVMRKTSHLTRVLVFRVPPPVSVEEEEETVAALPSREQSSSSFGGDSSRMSWSQRGMQGLQELRSSKFMAQLASFSERASTSASSMLNTKTTTSDSNNNNEPEPVPVSSVSSPLSSSVLKTEEEPQSEAAPPHIDEFVTADAPPGPLGLSLDGEIQDHAIVTGFVELRDGTQGALELHGGIVPGSMLVEINGEDVSTLTLDEIRTVLGELSGEPRTLKFLLPPPMKKVRRMTKTTQSFKPVFAEDPKKRRKFEVELILKHDKTQLSRKECWMLIDTQWMQRWAEYALRDGPAPGPITNGVLLQPEWKERVQDDALGRPDIPRPGLEVMTDYRAVPPLVWCLFQELHGSDGAPLLGR